MTSPHAGDVVWISGASKGIGRALAIEMASRGYRVAASARGHDELDSLARFSEAESMPGSISAFPLDVTNPESVASVQGSILSTFGSIDVAVLNAGTHKPTPANAFNRADFDELFQLNVMGCVNMLETLLPTLLGQRSGRVAIVASLAGYRGLPTAAAYGASKAALINLCEALRIELEGSGVIVQLINPGFVKTPLTDKNPFEMPSLISAETAAQKIADGLARDRFEIRFPLLFAGIMSVLRHLPFSLYSYLIRKQTQRG